MKKVLVFDSGIGGLFIFNELKKVLPGNQIDFLADEGYFPYGEKPLIDLTHRLQSILKFAENKNYDIVVVACNTASSIIDTFSDLSKVVITTGKPTAELAMKEAKNKMIGVWATDLTTSNRYYQNLISSDYRVTACKCSDLVPLIENNLLDSDELKNAVLKHLNEVLGVDCLIMGCTHFTYLEGIVSSITKDIKLISSTEAVSNEVCKYVTSNKDENYESVYYTTKDIDSLKKKLHVNANVICVNDLLGDN